MRGSLMAVECLQRSGMAVHARQSTGPSPFAGRHGFEVVARDATRHHRPATISQPEALMRTLGESFPVVGRKAVVFAVSSDKQYIPRCCASWLSISTAST